MGSKKTKYSQVFQHVVSIAIIIIVSFFCYFIVQYVGYRVVALLLLVVVSLLAMFFSITPVLIAAILSALIWDYFFIPPLLTLHISNAEDGLMLLMYFVVASLNTVLTIKIRNAEKIARDREEKENSIRLYNTLLNSLSHELRTPISTIIAVTDTLKDNFAKLSAENRDELLKEMEQAGIRLDRQVGNLLNMSRLESGFLKLKMDWCDLNDIIFNIINKLTAANYAQTILFDADETLPLIKLDAGIIEQIVYNILHNSLQYTPNTATITIKAICEEENCVITIADNGKGFTEKEIAHIFDKFYRIPNTKAGGTGLGLSIVKGFTEAHNGKVSASNLINGGACFTITIPVETSYLKNLKHE